MKSCRSFCILLTALLGVLSGSAAEPARIQLIKDVEYARVDTNTLKLDLHLPLGKARGLLLVWVHGGAWRSGSKSGMPLGKLVEDGYPIASVDYRLSPTARFPAQIHDLKAAIRFLRSHGKGWGLDPARIVVAGDSAGGHLAALVGVSNGQTELEGTVGADQGTSSNVQGIISFYGAANLSTILDQSTPHGLKVRVPALELLLGGQPKDLPALTRLASPVFHVDRHDPPLLLLHGDQDPQMPINQAHELYSTYQKAKAPVQFMVVHGAAHGGAAFYDVERLREVKKFLRRYL